MKSKKLRNKKGGSIIITASEYSVICYEFGFIRHNTSWIAAPICLKRFYCF